MRPPIVSGTTAVGSIEVPTLLPSQSNGNQTSLRHENVFTQNFLGKSHIELATWLSQTWLKDGPPICVIQGFPGVGKTFFARSLLKTLDYPCVMVTMPAVETNQADDLFLDLATELSFIERNEMASAVDAGTSLPWALEQVLRKPIMIVVDEFQQALDQSGKPISGLITTLERIANRLHFPGRMLLLSNRFVEQSKWSEASAIRTLSALDAEAAEVLLDKLLKETNRSQEVPFERQRDVVNWLGCNPRAIKVFVGSLEYDSLDDLIGLSPESWELREREVSPEFLNRLEHALLERTLDHLKDETNKLLQRVSIFRKPVKRKAFEILLPARSEFGPVRDELISRFLMEQHGGWYALHPIVKEISMQRLKKNVTELRQTHSKAADYYTRHFTAKDIVLGSGLLGGYFVEARYHLVQARREKDLKAIAERYSNHLTALFHPKTVIPQDPDERDESIAVLSALLETTSDRKLEYYLAQLYEACGNPGDLQMALFYATRATGLGALTESWKLRFRLEEELNGPETALQVFRETIDNISADKDCVGLYQTFGEMLVQAGKHEEAIALLREGVKRLPTSQRVVALYLRCWDLLVQAGKHEEAIALLQEEISHASTERDSFTLYLNRWILLSQVGKHEEAIALLREGIDLIPADRHTAWFYLRYGNLLAQAGRHEKAITLLQEGINRLPANRNVAELYIRYGDLLTKAGKREKAIVLLQEGIHRIPADQNIAGLYLRCSDLLTQANKHEEAISLLQEGIHRIPADRKAVALYLRCGDRLAKADKRAEAIALFQEGIHRIPADQNIAGLYLRCSDLLAKTGECEKAISLLQEGINLIPADQDVYTLYLNLWVLLAQSGEREGAITLLQEGINRIPADKHTAVAYLNHVDLLLQSGEREGAITLLQEGINHIPADKDRAILYAYLKRLGH